MQLSEAELGAVIEKIEFAKLYGERARLAGANGRIGVHGKHCEVNIVRLTIDGQTGYGSSTLSREEAQSVVGQPLGAFVDGEGLVLNPFRLALEYPLLDWLGRRRNKPVYELVSEQPLSPGEQLSVPCYDTSLYFDDLHLPDERDAVKLLQEEAQEGYAKGHRHFKIKVGRGGRHMPLLEGTKRDIAIVRGISEVAGPAGKLMIDANNAYNLNLAKEVLGALSDVNLYWLEEAFHEDDALYADLKSWLAERNQQVLIADGEGLASPFLVDWAVKGFVDVLQYDIIHPGFTFWLELGRKLDEHGLRTAPHCYGNAYGIYVSGHLAPSIAGFQFVEWDDITIGGMDASAYQIREGTMLIPSLPGFGLQFDDELFTHQSAANGWTMERG
ncbi:enolase C-terminal domain-like protein [Paenibacillus methanolicus]|uniref:L-alanine-DL-glutamate epimerase-like enolase superfamily enzyme n=1 Tax=Paenibacillus methanolicus TaxID=582686 RepID=A0A5S5CEL1_9BACL|nr:enolase C-terminal domain-like protein [Paenibacillus methanolicus]TYP76736.1 L-alanine-DL-glutamate epimerase-like enolase superfamily enzyme [Paenibacillus methanolicus]